MTWLPGVRTEKRAGFAPGGAEARKFLSFVTGVRVLEGSLSSSSPSTSPRAFGGCDEMGRGVVVASFLEGLR